MIRVCRSLLLVLLLSACSVTGPPDEEREDLRRNRERWRSQRIQSYEYVLQQLCYCPPELARPARVTVRDGQVASVIDVERSTAVPADRRNTLTVEDLFARVEEALNRNAAELQVEYDPELGYPISISIDYSKQVIDEELSFRASALRRID